MHMFYSTEIRFLPCNPVYFGPIQTAPDYGVTLSSDEERHSYYKTLLPIVRQKRCVFLEREDLLLQKKIGPLP